MKQAMRVLTLIAALGLAVPADLAGQGYLFLTGGGGGVARATSAGIEAGKIFPKEKPRYLGGGGFSLAFNGRPGETLGRNFQSEIRNEQEINAVAGIRLLKGLCAVATGGVSNRAERDFAFINGRRELIAELRGTVHGAGSGQLRLVYKRFVVGAGYHSRRGFVAGLGFTFSSFVPDRRTALRGR